MVVQSLGALVVVAAAVCQPSRADCVADAAAFHEVHEGVLRSILWNESRMNPRAMSHDTNGTKGYGISQTNSVHLKSLQGLGIAPPMLMDACIGTYVAGWHLAGHIRGNPVTKVRSRGNTWEAVGCYNSCTPIFNQAYANQIAGTMSKWGMLPVDYVPYPSAPRSTAEALRKRRAGKATTNSSASY